jgi:hypothetical protein
MGSYLKEAQILREAMDVAMKILTDEQALHAVAIYPLWRSDGEYQKDDRVRYGDVLYKCLTPHTAQPSWTPTDAPSLWAKVLTSDTGAPLPWEQPESTNPYMKGDKVTHKEQTWVSTIDNNVWEPGVYGWEVVEE